ncbi:MAG: extracellular solute-binding protein, partial [Armatimonadetes bacterium]|nr:extracellular solute-binding protein [Armatimonadota bacterium]
NPDVLVCIEWRDAVQAHDMIRRWTGSYRNQAPDLTVMTDLWLAEHAGDVLPPPASIQRAVKGLFPPSVLARGVIGDRVAGVPWTVATEALYYRSDLLAEMDMSPPASFEELADCAVKLADPPHRYGIGIPGPGMGGEELLHVLANAMGHVEPDENGTIQPGAEPFVKALSLVVEMQSRGAVEPEVLTWSEMDLAGLMAQGRLGMMIARPWLAAVLERAEMKRQSELKKALALGEDGAARVAELQAARIEWAVAPLPTDDGGSGHLTVDWLVALSTSDTPQIAFRFMQYMASNDRQRALAVLGGIPATRALARQMSAEPAWQAHLAGFGHARGLPMEQWELLRRQLADALGHAVSGRRTPAEALERAGEIR